MKTIIKNIVTFMRYFFSSLRFVSMILPRRKEVFSELIQHLCMCSLLWRLSLIYEKILSLKREISPFFPWEFFFFIRINIYHSDCGGWFCVEGEIGIEKQKMIKLPTVGVASLNYTQKKITFWLSFPRKFLFLWESKGFCAFVIKSSLIKTGFSRW